MKPGSTGDRLQAAAALGLGELRGAYNDRKRRIELEAENKRQKAKTAIERARIKAVKAKELADLETAMYEARIAAQQAQAKAKKTRQAAGVYTPGERIGRVAHGTAVAAKGFYTGLTTSDPKRRRR